MMNSLKTIPILGKHALGHAIIHKEKSLENLHFKRLYLVVRQEMPWISNPRNGFDYQYYD
jgi:hypothetical protein